MTFSQRQVMQATKRIKRSAGMALLALFYLPASALASEDAIQLVPFHATYSAIKWSDEIGQVEMELKPLSTDQYSLTYSSKVSKFFLSDKRYEHTIFRVQDDQLIPDQYYYSRTGTGPDKKLSVEFGKPESTSLLINEKETLPWQGELDNQIYRVDFPLQLAAGKKEAHYSFINERGKSRTYHMKVMGNETLTLPYGKIDTIKAEIVRENSSRETYMWFAPSLNFNLVRLQQFKDGDEQGDVQLKSYQTSATQ